MQHEEPPQAFDLVSWVAELVAIPVFGVLLVGLAALGTAAGALLAEAVGLRVLRNELGLGMLFFALIAAITTFGTRYSPVSQRVLDCRLELWPHGIAHGWGKSLRFVPYARMRDVDVRGDRLAVTLVDGDVLSFAPAGAKRRIAGEEEDPAYRARTCQTLADLLQEGIVREKNAASARVRTRPADFEATVALLARRGRPVTEWHDELRALASGATRYRVATLRDDTLARIVTDADVAEDAREAAERVLAARR